ncbi:hypothetical protein V5799_027482, partial [Amblyomma americanum]
MCNVVNMILESPILEVETLCLRTFDHIATTTWGLACNSSPYVADHMQRVASNESRLCKGEEHVVMNSLFSCRLASRLTELRLFGVCSSTTVEALAEWIADTSKQRLCSLTLWTERRATDTFYTSLHNAEFERRNHRLVELCTMACSTGVAPMYDCVMNAVRRNATELNRAAAYVLAAGKQSYDWGPLSLMAYRDHPHLPFVVRNMCNSWILSDGHAKEAIALAASKVSYDEFAQSLHELRHRKDPTKDAVPKDAVKRDSDVYISFLQSESEPVARSNIEMVYPDEMMSKKLDESSCEPWRYPILFFKFALPMSTIDPPDIEIAVAMNGGEPQMVVNNKFWTREDDVDYDAVTVDREATAYTERCVPKIMCPIPRMVTESPYSSQHGGIYDKDSLLTIPVYGSDVVLQECVQQVHQCVARLVERLGPSDWSAPPTTARVVEAWNELLHWDDAYIEPHMPGQVELRAYPKEEGGDVDQLVRSMKIQRLNTRPNDAFSRTTPPVRWIHEFENCTGMYCGLLAELHNHHRYSGGNNYEEEEYMKRRDYDTAEAVEADWKLACNASTAYAPYGVGLVVTANSSDTVVMNCNDARRMLGRVATYLFLRFHAHHVRLLDVRTTGLLKSANVTLTSSILHMGFRLCTQVRVLRGSVDSVVSTCAASLATTVNVVEVDVRDYIFLQGVDVGRFACPYATSHASAVKSVRNSGLQYTWTERMLNRFENVGREQHALLVDTMCINKPGNLNELHTFAAVVSACDATTLKRVEMSGDSMFNARPRDLVSRLLTKEHLGLEMIRLSGFANVLAEDYAQLGPKIAECAPNLKCVALLENEFAHDDSDTDCAALTAFLKAMPLSVVMFECNDIPVEGREQFIQEVSKRNVRVQYLPSAGMRESLDGRAVDFKVRSVATLSAFEPGANIDVDEVISSCNGDVNAPVDVRYVMNVSLASALKLVSLEFFIKPGDIALEQMLDTIVDILHVDSLSNTLRMFTMCTAKSASDVILELDTIPFDKTVDNTCGYGWLDPVYLQWFESKLSTALTTTKVGEKLTELKLLYVLHEKWQHAPLELGSWVAHHENLYSVSMWTHCKRQTEDLCDAIVREGGPKATLTEFSVCRFDARSIRAVGTAVLRNRTEFRRAITAIVRENDTEDTALQGWDWLSFLVYRNHPALINELRLHFAGSTLTASELTDK